MHFDKESKSEDFFLGGGGGGGERERGGAGGEFQPEKNTKYIRCLLICCAHALYKISSSWLKMFN